MSENWHADRLLWIDVETTSLDPKEGQLLEVGARVTDMCGRTLTGDDMHFSRVLRNPWIRVNQNTKYATLYMHQKNMLIEQSLASDTSTTDIEDLFDKLIETTLGLNKEQLDNDYTDEITLHVAGTNPQFDIAWLERCGIWAEHIAPYVSHRRFDMATLRQFMQSLGITTPSQQRTDHRADTCLERDINEYRKMRENLRFRLIPTVNNAGDDGVTEVKTLYIADPLAQEHDE
ncbi:hypothetical protein BAAM0499_06090 [Bifidobacterium animalis subsp. animalis MCC 0499]|uniref:hypothetical protein n=1 Tax=Bifidobacterium animalis TaxID=28025 RepID=UPI00069C2E88|nr:hypothetical protein [Bifidobacterium animalis]KOA61185.1 hypothetical protein BAAM0499_06090 [Bifidobacterium animalis subsp. animalis MCC 0499]